MNKQELGWIWYREQPVIYIRTEIKIYLKMRVLNEGISIKSQLKLICLGKSIKSYNKANFSSGMQMFVMWSA